MLLNYFWSEDSSEKKTVAFKMAVAAGHEELANKYVAAGVDPNTDDGYAVKWANDNNSKMLEMLLKCPNIDPCVDDNKVLRKMCRSKSEVCVKLVINSPKFKCPNLSGIVYNLLATESYAMLDVLTNNTCIEKSDHDKILAYACAYNYKPLIDKIFKLSSANLAYDNYLALYNSASHGYMDTVGRFLTDSRVISSGKSINVPRESHPMLENKPEASGSYTILEIASLRKYSNIADAVMEYILKNELKISSQ